MVRCEWSEARGPDGIPDSIRFRTASAEAARRGGARVFWSSLAGLKPESEGEVGDQGGMH